MPDNSMYVEPVIAVNADMSGVQNPSMYKPVHIVNMPEAPTGGVTSVNGQTGDVTLTASDIGALPSSTVIPSKTSDLQNDSGYITASDVPAQVNSDWNASSGVAEILNKPTIPTVDQTYNASSTNAQSGTAVAGAIAAQPSKPLVDGNCTTVTETSNDVKIDFTTTAGITDVQKVAALPANPVSTVLYLIEET